MSKRSANNSEPDVANKRPATARMTTRSTVPPHQVLGNEATLSVGELPHLILSGSKPYKHVAAITKLTNPRWSNPSSWGLIRVAGFGNSFPADDNDAVKVTMRMTNDTTRCV